MKRSSFLLTSGIWLLTFGFSPAILDTNNNRVSDIWERQYNAGELFPASFDPQADEDKDGWNNAQEAAAGTDPNDANPPDGFIRPATEHVPAVIGEQNGVPYVISPESIKVTWPTLTGKQYTLLYSPDLTQGSWLPVGDPVIANGGVSEYVFYEVNATDKCFWRVAVTDVDTDGDGLNDHEENQYGSNPASADADDDNLSDKEEAALETDSNDADTDDDGADDGEDAVPLDAEINWPKTPENRYVWIEQVAKTGAKAVSRHGHILFPESNGGSSALSEAQVLWDSGTSSWVELAGASSWSGSGFESGEDPDVFDHAWDHIDDMNDDGVVVGRSKYEGPYAEVAWVLASAIMKWQMSGTATDQYAEPLYIVPGFTYIDPWGDLEKSLMGEAPRIADDGTVSAMSYHVSYPTLSNWSFETKWVTGGAHQTNHSGEMAVWSAFDGYCEDVYHSGAVLGNDAGLLVEYHSDVPKTVLHYRNGAAAESLEGILPNSAHGIRDTDIGRTPATSENPEGRIWFSVNHAGGDDAFLEKRAGGSGVTRWHNPPSMGEGAIRLNARGEAITSGRIATQTAPAIPPKLWRNGKYTDLNELTSKPSSVTITQAIDLASNGIILVQASENNVTKTGLLLPVDIEFVFGFGPLGPLNDAARQDLETKLSEMNPVYQDIKPGRSVFVIKGNPQGDMDAEAANTKLWTIQISSSAEALKSALSSTPYVVFSGHANMGLGPVFNAAAAHTTSDFFNIGNPQTAINFPYLKDQEGFVNLDVTDQEIPDSSNNYWVLPDIVGVGAGSGIERFDNDDGIHPPGAIPFHSRTGMPRNRGWHFNRDNGNDEYIIVNIPAGARAADLPKLGYKAFFYNSCSTVRDYSEVFSAYQGSIFIGSNLAARAALGEGDEMVIDQSNYYFAQKLMAGESWQAILSAINGAQAELGTGADVYRLINF